MDKSRYVVLPLGEQVLWRDGLKLSEYPLTHADIEQAECLGLSAEDATGAPWSRLYTQEARDRIAAVFAALSAVPRVLPLTLRAHRLYSGSGILFLEYDVRRE